VAVMLYVGLRRFSGMMLGVLVMPVRRMGVMRRGFVVTRLMVVRGMTMMLGRVFVVFGCLAMMCRRFLGHSPSLILDWNPVSARNTIWRT